MPPSLGARDPRLASLLRDLGPQIRQGGAPPEAPLPRCPTGLPDVDRLLGGGFPRGGVSEIAGPPSSGRTSLVLALLARATERGEVTALVDAADAFDPPSAAAAGVELARLLWVRPPDPAAALRGASHLLAARGFAAVVLDLAGLGGRAAVGARLWPRLRRETAATDTALVVVSDQRVVQSFADLALDLGPAVPRFEGAFFVALECKPGEAGRAASRRRAESQDGVQARRSRARSEPKASEVQGRRVSTQVNPQSARRAARSELKASGAPGRRKTR